MYMYLHSELVEFFAFYTDICNVIRRVATPAVGFSSKLKLFWLATLLSWPLTFRLLNGVTGHRCHGLLSCQFSAFCDLLFSTYLGSGTGRTDRQWTWMRYAHPMWAGKHRKRAASVQRIHSSHELINPSRADHYRPPESFKTFCPNCVSACWHRRRHPARKTSHRVESKGNRLTQVYVGKMTAKRMYVCILFNSQ